MAEITKSYESRDVEKRWHAAWQDARAFAGATTSRREPYAIVIPPPNVTGVLTMGHVLNNTLQDVLIRRARLEGRAALGYPAPITPASRPRRWWSVSCARTSKAAVISDGRNSWRRWVSGGTKRAESSLSSCGASARRVIGSGPISRWTRPIRGPS